MKSIKDLLSTIRSIPWLDESVDHQAAVLQIKLGISSFDIFDTFRKGRRA